MENTFYLSKDGDAPLPESPSNFISKALFLIKVL